MPEKSFEQEVLERLIKIEMKLESWDSSKKQIYDNQKDIIKLKEQTVQQGKDIEDLQDRNKWLSRTSAGAVIGAIASAVIAALVVIV